jgi:hypothetical protein
VDRRLARIGLAVCLAIPAFLSTRFALGAPNDAAAQKLRDQAINQDYLGTDFAAAEKKLTDALALCKKMTDCSPSVRARVHCDLGVVEFMLHKVDLARTEFATALIEDPTVDVDRDLSNTDVRNEFAALKNGTPSPGATASPPAPAQPPPTPQVATLSHTPPLRQQADTPLPLFVQVPSDLGVAKVVVRFKVAAAQDWKTASLRKMGDGYGGELPCGDIANKEGELQYFIQALDANGDLVAASGRSGAPQRVAIVKKLEGEAPHLPGEPPPLACKDGHAQVEREPAATEASDCPPGFPGCHGEGPPSCESNEDCMAGEMCVDQTCKSRSEVEQRVYKKNWLSLGVQADALVMPGTNDTCLGSNPPNGYTCFRSGTGQYYAAVPAKGIDDQVIGGFAQNLPMIRVVVGYDRAIARNLTLGARLGYAVSGGGPTRPGHGSTPGGSDFMPVNVEARIAYFFGKNSLARKGVRFFAFASGGMMEVDAFQSIDVRAPGAGAAQTNIDAWTKTGLGFVALGPGLMFAVTPSSGLVLELKPTVLFPTFGFSLAGTLGYTIGL